MCSARPCECFVLRLDHIGVQNQLEVIQNVPRGSKILKKNTKKNPRWRGEDGFSILKVVMDSLASEEKMRKSQM